MFAHLSVHAPFLFKYSYISIHTPCIIESEFDKLAILERFKIQLERSNVTPTYTMQPDFSWAIDNNFWPKEIIPKRYITLLPFCSKHLQHKKWPFYNELISMIRKENKNIEIVIVPGPGEVFESSSFDLSLIHI